MNPNEITALVALLDRGRASEVESRARVLVSKHPNVGMLWKIIGVAQVAQGKEALPALRRATELLPDDAETHSNLGAAFHDRGRWHEALASFRRALQIRPDSVDALVQAADSQRAIGKVREAVADYQRALEVDPRSFEAHNNLGNAFLELGRYEDAANCYRCAVQIKPDDADAHSNLGNALRQLGRVKDAMTSGRRAIELDPNSSAAHNNMGIALAALGQPEQAVASYRRSLILNPDHVEALDNLGNALRDLGQLQQALNCFRRAIELAPGRATTHRNLGNALLDLGRLDEAAANYAQALTLRPDYSAAHLNIGMVLRRQGLAAEAEASCRAAVAIQPDFAEALSFLGELRADQGEFSDAEELFRRAIAIDPDLPNAWFSIATHRKMTNADTAWRQGAEALLAKRLPLRHEISLRYALGKYFDDLENYDQAFGSYRHANELTKRYGLIYEGARLTSRVDNIIDRLDGTWFRRCQVHANTSERPVFIVGMPRSGTSLSEQILASHPAVCGAGELTYWDTAFAAFDAAGTDPGMSIPPAMAGDYLDRLVAVSGGAPRVVDKMPANFMNLGLIHAAFPNAKIIHMRRHPIDTCLSIYFQYFPSTHRYANDLDNLAHYYGEYARIMDHWRGSIPATALLEVPYEALVAEQEAWSRRMVEFIGLPWDPRCLDFHQTKRVVITTSKWQVRQKIHASSAGRWRNYEKFVGPLQGLVLAHEKYRG